jgi:hypothetical protein
MAILKLRSQRIKKELTSMDQLKRQSKLAVKFVRIVESEET